MCFGKVNDKMEYEQFLKEASSVTPSVRQAKHFDLEFYAFVHFTVNTFTDLEWGLGNEPESIFNPTFLDCDQWVEAIKSAGMRGLILTAKHHDGFCLWPSKYTEHSVKNSPWKNGKGDVVRECAQACRRGGIKFGIYLSPWDRNSPYYGTDEYNDYYCNQLTELLTGYGELFEIWFDGACGEGENGKKQVYDFDRYIKLIRKYQPNAVIFNDAGPDIRWCGNEVGSPRSAEWAVVPRELCHRAEVQTHEGPDATCGALDGLYNTNPNIGSLEQIRYSKGLCFVPSEFDMSMRDGWFYHSNEEPHSVERLMKTYIETVGGNGCFNLNIPPKPSGLFDERDVTRLSEFGKALNQAFGKEIVSSYKVVPVTETQCLIKISLSQEEHISYIILEEDLSVGQRVESFSIKKGISEHIFGQENLLAHGTTIGHKRIIPLNTKTDALTVEITSARTMPSFRAIRVF